MSMNQKKLIGELCMWMLKMLTYFDSFAVDNIPKKKKIPRKQKYQNNYLYNSSKQIIQINNVRILKYSFYWFYVKSLKFARLYKFIFI